MVGRGATDIVEAALDRTETETRRGKMGLGGSTLVQWVSWSFEAICKGKRMKR